MRLEYFSMVDRVVHLAAADGKIIAESTVPDASPVFEGHFPGYPLMPGVLLIETMAQTSGYLLLARYAFSRMPFLAQVKEAKLRRFVPPGTLLSVTADMLHDGAGYAVTRAEISVRWQAGGGGGADVPLDAVRCGGAEGADAGTRGGDRVAVGMTCEVWVTGIGLLSSLGEGAEQHWERLTAASPLPVIEATAFAPYPIHPLAPVNFDLQIRRRATSGRWSRGSASAPMPPGWRWADAKVAGDTALLSRTHMIVAAGGGERDNAVDSALAATLAPSNEPEGPVLNARLATDLRPTLFLAQLSNLLAGSISIVHGVRGSSRTFMGEESAGFDSVRVAFARLAADQAELALVGGAYNAARPDMMLLYGAGAQLLPGGFRPVWQRADQPGFVAAAWAASWCWRSVPMPRRAARAGWRGWWAWSPA